MPPLRRSFRLAWPLILSNLTVPLMGMVDTAVVGRLEGPHNLAAVALGAAVMNLVVWGLGFLRTATGGFTAQAFGANDAGGQRAIFARAFLLVVVASILVLALAPLIVPLSARLFAARGDLRLALDAYLGLRLLGSPMILATLALNGWFLGRQETHVPLAVMLAANGVNAAMTVLLVIGLGYGIGGAALGTLCGDAAGLTVAAVCWRRRWPVLPGRVRRSDLLAAEPLRRFLALGRDIFLRTALLEGAFLTFVALAAREGDLVLAANAVLLNFFTLQAYGLDGFADAAETMTGRAVGRRDVAEVRAAIKASFVNAALLALGLAVAYAAGGKFLIALLTTLPEVRAEAMRYLPFVVVLPLVSAAAFVWDGVFFGATRGRDIRNAMALALAVFLALAFALRGPFGNAGLWTAMLGFLAVRGLLLTMAFRRAGDGSGFIERPLETASAVPI